MTQQPNGNDVLMGGGGGPAAWKFDEPGTVRQGTVATPPVARQEREYDPNNPGGGKLKTFPSGDPIMGVIVEVDTAERDPSIDEDDGRRTFYVEGRYIKEAVRNAVRQAGAPGLEVGGQLVVKFTHREDPLDKRSRKYWQVSYTAPANAALMGTQEPAAPSAQPVQPQFPVTPTQVGAPPATMPNPVQPVQQAAPAPAAAAATPAGLTPAQMASFQEWQTQQAAVTAAQG